MMVEIIVWLCLSLLFGFLGYQQGFESGRKFERLIQQINDEDAGDDKS